MLRPAPIVFLVLTLSILSALVFGTSNFDQIRSTRSYQFYDLLALAILSGGFVFALHLGGKVTFSSHPYNRMSTLTIVRYEKMLFGLVTLGYLVWASLAISRGLGLQSFLDILNLEKNSVVNTKSLLKGIAGVTSLTQLTPILSAILGFLRLHALPWRTHFLLISLFGLIRAVLNAERLSIFEFLVPFAVVHLFYSPKLQWKKLVPIVLTFPVIFATLEYTRSWTNYYSKAFDGSFLDFIILGLFSYYATSVNNGFLLIDKIGEGPRHPFYSFNFFYEFPVYGQDIVVGNEVYNPREGLITFFKIYSNPEFNNPGGLTSLVLDFGWVIAFFYLLLVGFLIGMLWKRAMQDDRAVFLYSALFLGLMELPRYYFFGSSRFFPSLAFGVLILLRKNRL